METALRDKVVVITGGGGGIGRACALAFANEGASVVVSDIDLDAARAVARAVENLGCRSLAVRTNVASLDSVQELFRQTLDDFGRLDVLVNNAGIFHSTPVLDLAVDEWDQLMGVNLRGAFLCAQAALRIMMQRGSGKIVNLGSMGGQVGGIVAGADYSASKAGVICLTKSLAKVAGPAGINVNCVNPGIIDTPMTRSWKPEHLEKLANDTPLRRRGTADEVALVVVFLASAAASYVNGAHVDVNGGLHMA